MSKRGTDIKALPVSADTRRLNPGLFDGPGGVEAPIAVAATKKRLRQSSKPKLNSNELAFKACLEVRLPNAFIWEQDVHLQLANGTRYTPDFVSYEPMNHGRLVCWEVKGTKKIFDGAGEKLKFAASKFRGMVFYLVWMDGGVWKEQRILP